MSILETWQADILQRGRCLPRDVFMYGIGIATEFPKLFAAREVFHGVQPENKTETEGDVTVLPLAGALSEGRHTGLCDILMKESGEALTANYYFAESFARAKGGLFIDARSGTTRVRIATTAKDGASDSIIIVARRGAKVFVSEEITGDSSVGFTSADETFGRTVFLFAEDGSVLTHSVLYKELARARWFYNRIAYAGVDAVVNCVEKEAVNDRNDADDESDNTQSSMLKSDTRGIVLGHGGSIGIIGLISSGGLNHRDSYHGVLHKASGSTSRIRAFGEARGASRIIYRGGIVVPPHISGVSASQRGNFFLHGAKAEIDAIPALEIEHPDTHTEHALSISSFTEYELLYPRLRGLSEKTAAKLALAGRYAGFLDESTRGMSDMHDIRLFFKKARGGIEEA